MFINRSKDGNCNLCGRKIAIHRKALQKSQKQLADMLQLAGLDVDKNAIQRIEAGKRFVTDIELKIIAKVLAVSMEELTETEENME